MTPWMRLNAMGRGYLKWALENRPLFRVFASNWTSADSLTRVWWRGHAGTG